MASVRIHPLRRVASTHCAALAIVIGLGACAGRQASPEFEPQELALQRAATAPTVDAAFLTLNRLAPAFGGMVADGEGGIRVALIDDRARQTTQPIVQAYLRRRDLALGRAEQTYRFTFFPARHSWFTLEAYRRAMADAMALDDVTSLDIDEACNCLALGIARPEARHAVIEYMARHGIPEDAVRFDARAPFVMYASLHDRFRPSPGGVRIRFNAFLGTGGICTAGPVVERAGVRSVLVNSHCTRIQGGTESTEFYQPATLASAVADQWATESVDPPWIAGLPGCAAGRVCRRSDAALATLDDPAQGELGRLAVPRSICTTSACGVDMDSAPARLSVVGAGGASMVGETLGKIGQTTGFTSGTVAATCVDVLVSAPPWWRFESRRFELLCQDTVTAAADPGDSGSPVFRPLAQGEVRLAGLLWGGPPTAAPAGTPMTYAFSPWSAIESELGAMTVVAPTSPPPPVESRKPYCDRSFDACMSEVGQPQGPRPQQCVWERTACRRGGLP